MGQYGTESGNPKCANCMVHSGYEASAVNYAFGSLKGMYEMVAGFMKKHEDKDALALLNEPVKPVHSYNPLVQIEERGRRDASIMSQPMHTAASAVDDLEVVPGFEHEQLQGLVPNISNEEELREALEKAFDYRGDITITCKDGSKLRAIYLIGAKRRPCGNRWCAFFQPTAHA